LTFRKEYGHYFAAFVDKRKPKWMVELGCKVIEWARKDMRAHYMKKQFENSGGLDLKVELEDCPEIAFGRMIDNQLHRKNY
jgi:hypothetical protein